MTLIDNDTWPLLLGLRFENNDSILKAGLRNPRFMNPCPILSVPQFTPFTSVFIDAENKDASNPVT
jgi:hypothetical protein